jgi:RNA polymerase sigma factor (sigma-70 family)
MDERDWLADRFEAARPRLRAVAYRMLGSSTEADDAVQEAWLRLSRAKTNEVENLGGWLTTVVGRVCLSTLHARRSRREEFLGASLPEPIVRHDDGTNPEHQLLMADSVGSALLVVLDTLTPSERVAFVLHDVFGVPFDEIAPIVGRSPVAARQLASRARRRVRRQGAEFPDADLTRQREIVDAFLAASRGGDFDALIALLDPDVVLRTDKAAVHTGAPQEVRRSPAVAKHFSGWPLSGARAGLVNGSVGLVWAPAGHARGVIVFDIVDGKIVEIEMVADVARLSGLDLTPLEA